MIGPPSCLPTSAEYLHGVLCAVRTEPAAPPIAAALGGSEVVARFRRFLGIRERQLDAAGMYWGLTTVLGTALLLTSVEFEASEPAPSPWPAAAGPRPHAVAIQTAVSTLPQIHERAVTGRRTRRPSARHAHLSGRGAAQGHRRTRRGGVPHLRGRPCGGALRWSRANRPGYSTPWPCVPWQCANTSLIAPRP